MEPQAVVGLPRWAPLVRFAERWYAEPLGAAGLSAEAIEAAERRLGRRLPPAVAEWYQLVGHRLCDVNQDQPVRLDQLRVVENGLIGPQTRLPLWNENQGNWSFDAELDSTDDEPWVSVDSQEPAWRRRDRLVRALLGMLYSDTLVGVWSGRGGPLGRLGPGVIGGYRDQAPDAVDEAVAALPAIDAVTNPYFDEPLRGHDALVIRGSAGIWEWMAANEEAHAQASRILDLTNDGGTRYLVVAIDAVPPDGRDALLAILERRVEPLRHGRLRTASYDVGLTRAAIDFETPDPDAALADLRCHLPRSVVAAMRAGHRSPYTMRFVPLWPEDLQAFAQPI
jgi:hypothetical protein